MTWSSRTWLGVRWSAVAFATSTFVAASAPGCASEEPAPAPTFTSPLFTDAFDDAAPLPRGWGSARGDVSLDADPGAPSGGRVLRARALAPQRKEAALARALSATGATSLTCRLAVNLEKSSGKSPQTVVRIDVLGGVVFIDLLEPGWRLFGKFAGQEFAEGSARPSKSRWATASVTIENTGKIVAVFDGEERIKHIDVKAAPLDVAKASIEIGVFAPPADTDTEAAFDDVQCTAK